MPRIDFRALTQMPQVGIDSTAERIRRTTGRMRQEIDRAVLGELTTEFLHGTGRIDPTRLERLTADQARTLQEIVRDTHRAGFSMDEAIRRQMHYLELIERANQSAGRVPAPPTTRPAPLNEPLSERPDEPVRLTPAEYATSLTGAASITDAVNQTITAAASQWPEWPPSHRWNIESNPAVCTISRADRFHIIQQYRDCALTLDQLIDEVLRRATR